MKYVFLLSLAFICFVSVSCKGQTSELPESTSTVNATANHAFNTDSLLYHVKTLSSDAFEGRRTGTAGALKAKDYIVNQFKNLGLNTVNNSYEQAFSFNLKEKSYQAVNVLGQIQGSAKSDEYIVISAHYDHEGIKNGEIYNGADDDASGISALFAFAEYFSAHPPKHNVILAAFDAEELGLKGSDYFVKNPIVPVEKILLNINLDMISRSVKQELFAVGTNHYKQFIPVLNAFENFGLVQMKLGHDGNDGLDDWTFASDHAAFHKAKIPFIYFGVADHKDYHKPTDDYENIDKAFYKDAVQSIINIFQLLDATDL